MKKCVLILMLINIFKLTLTMEEDNSTIHQQSETHQNESYLLFLPIELIAKLLEPVFFDETVIENATDIYDAVDKIQLHKYTTSKNIGACKLLYKIKNTALDKYNTFYLPLLTNRFLKHTETGLRPKRCFWSKDDHLDLEISQFLDGSKDHSDSIVWSILSARYSDEQTRLIPIIIFYGADINVKIEHDVSLLHHCIFLKKHIVNVLLNYDADVNTKTNGTPLIMIICKFLSNRSDVLNIMTKLINKGANIQATDKAGKTALDIAIELEHSELIKLLTPKPRSI